MCSSDLPTALLNLTQAYWGLRHRALTQQFLETVIQIAPDDPFPHLALAELLIDKGRKADATPHLKRAKTRIHRDPLLATLLEKLEGKTAQVAAATTPARRIALKATSVKQSLAPEHHLPQAEVADLTPKKRVEPVPAIEATSSASPANDPVHTDPAPAETTP